MSTASVIAGKLEATFARSGFAEPSVAALRDASGVTLRTLYRHFPSREAMIVGALDARHVAYRAWLDEGRPEEPGDAAVFHVFERLAVWMADRAPTGCLCVQAVSAHPNSTAIGKAVKRHKADTRALLTERCLLADRTDPSLPTMLFVLHEGQTAASVTTDPMAAHAATLPLLRALLTPQTDGPTR